MVTLKTHIEKWKDCTECPLSKQRDRIVLGRGAIPCDVLFVGEAPGPSEDAIGEPFRGLAGLILDNDSQHRPGIVQHALPCHQESGRWVMDIPIAYCNLVCCFPREAKGRGDNEPEENEILACRPRLQEFITIAKPKLIVCVGSLASDYIEHDAYGKHATGAKIVDIIHPAATLGKRMPQSQKQQAIDRAIVVVRSAWEDTLQ